MKNLLQEKYQQIQKGLSIRLEEMKQKPPLGFKSAIPTLSDILNLIKITGECQRKQSELNASHDLKISELEEQIETLKLSLLCLHKANALDVVEAANND